MMRDEKNIGDGEIEKSLGLKKGIVARLGPKGIVGEASGSHEAGRGGGALG